MMVGFTERQGKIMARRPTRAASKSKQPAAVETSESIAEQTRLFLEAGNKIELIGNGVSGQPSMAANKKAKTAR